MLHIILGWYLAHVWLCFFLIPIFFLYAMGCGKGLKTHNELITLVGLLLFAHLRDIDSLQLIDDLKIIVDCDLHKCVVQVVLLEWWKYRIRIVGGLFPIYFLSSCLQGIQFIC